MDIETLNKLIPAAMQKIIPKGAELRAFRALLVPDTQFLTNQWQTHFDVTNCGYEVFDNLQKFVEIDGFKVNLFWRKATKNCFFCDKEGHIKKDCEEWKLLKTNEGKQPTTVVPDTNNEPENNSDSNEYFTETQGGSADNVSDETETPDILATPKPKVKKPAYLNSGSGVPNEDPVNRSLLDELRTDDEDSDDANSSTSSPGHRLRSSLTEKEVQMRSDLKKDQIKAKTKKTTKKLLPRVNLRGPEKGNPS
jgi:hypothetical protein